MIALLIILPLAAALISFLIKDSNSVKGFSLVVSAAIFLFTLYLISCNHAQSLSWQWIPQMNSNFALSFDGMSKMLCLLTALSFPLVFSSTIDTNYSKPNNFYGLMLLTMSGLMGVFLASDVLLFYFFWELALIPVYFLCSQYGGNKRIQATFKFFIYTFIGSLLMLVGIMYIYFQMPVGDFSLKAFYSTHLNVTQQNLAFWLFFLAFAIKMPIFPFHTWQPDAYEQSPTSVTMILSGVMVKMGVYATIRFVLPIFPDAVKHFSHLIIILSIIGIIYASLIAIKQDDIKRLIAYSSIAHIGLMCAAVFSMKEIGLQGVLLQMFNHGINVIGLWIVANAIEQQTGTRKMSELGGLATKAPALAILFTIMVLANVALPLTNAFIGEFLMFNGIFQYNIWAAVIAAISIILVAVYTLGALSKMFFGETTAHTANAAEASKNVNYSLAVIAMLIIILGVYAQPILNLTNDTVKAIFVK